MLVWLVFSLHKPFVLAKLNLLLCVCVCVCAGRGGGGVKLLYNKIILMFSLGIF